MCLSHTRGSKAEVMFIRIVTYRNPGVRGEEGCLEEKSVLKEALPILLVM